MSKKPKSRPCPSCGTPSTGKFCNECGAPLAGASCSRCGSELSAGAKFCNNCAHPVGGTASRESSLQPIAWGFAGVSIVLLVVVAISKFQTGGPNPGPSPVQQALPQSPRALADEYFNQAMMAREAGDDIAAGSSTGLALAAYREVALDNDGRFHVGLLHAYGGNPDSALAWADSISARAPQHLFASMLRQSVSEFTGDSEMARSAYAEFLRNYDVEIGLNRVEYQEHGNMIDLFLNEARAAQ